MWSGGPSSSGARAALVGLLALVCAAPARAAPESAIFTIAGAESEVADTLCDSSCDGGSDARLPATERRFSGTCLTHLADGTILLCEGSELLALGTDGRIRAWRSPGAGSIVDAEAAPDGSVAIIGRDGIARLLTDGSTEWLARRSGAESFGTGIATLPDGGVVVAGVGDDGNGFTSGELVALRADGTAAWSANLPHGRAVKYTSDELDDPVALPDGSIVVAQHARQRLLRIDANGRVRALPDAPKLGAVTSLAATDGGGLAVSADRGLFAVTAAGSFRRLTGGAAYEAWPEVPEALTADGRRASDAVLAGVRRLDALSDGTILALVDGAGGVRVVMIAPPRRGGRLAVALHPDTRRSLRAGVVEIVASRSARARVVVGHAAPVLVRLHPGRTRVHVRVPARTDPQVARITAIAPDDAIASHRLVFHSRMLLPATELHRAAREAERFNADAVGLFTVDRCGRRSAVRYDCRWRYENEELRSSGTARFELLTDGTIRYTESDPRGGPVATLLMEPRPPSSAPTRDPIGLAAVAYAPRHDDYRRLEEMRRPWALVGSGKLDGWARRSRTSHHPSSIATAASASSTAASVGP
jgi:hypothetical protein